MKIKSDKQTYYLKPEEMIFVAKPATIRTILGSCVSVTMFCRRLGAAAICHPVLPLCRESGSCNTSTCRNKYKYVKCVIPMMLKPFLKLGVTPKELEIKLFGGSQLHNTTPDNKKTIHVGAMNISMARQIITELKTNLKSYDVGGQQGRKIIFNCETGDVWVKKI